MTYPPAPWLLQGQAFQTIQPLQIPQVEPLLPEGLVMLPIWPGKTLGGVYLSRYESGSSLEYHELIVIGGLARRGSELGSWVSHIYVDHPDSVAGGREIWGLPKELAEFDWQPGQIVVRQGETLLCRFSYDWKSWQVPQHLNGISFGWRHRELLSFEWDAQGQFALTDVKLQVPPESPFASLGLDRPWLAVGVKNLQLTVREPRVIG